MFVKFLIVGKAHIKDWVHKYKNNRRNLTRKNKNAISYKVKKNQVKTALTLSRSMYFTCFYQNLLFYYHI